MDSLPHWGRVPRPQFLRAAKVDGIAGLGLMAGLLALAPARRRWSVAAGMAGAVLPDLDKPAAFLLGIPQLWPGPLHRFHSRVQQGREAPSRLSGEVALCLVGATLVLGVSRALRR
jgi:hypothetical protein